MQGMIKRGKSKLNKHVISQISKKNKGNKKIKTRNSKKNKGLECIPQKQKLFGLIVTVPLIKSIHNQIKLISKLQNSKIKTRKSPN